MTLKLYGIAASTCTMRVRTILNELDITDYEIISLSLPEMKAPEHLARQPFGRIPVLDDDGFILCESRAICKYDFLLCYYTAVSQTCGAATTFSKDSER